MRNSDGLCFIASCLAAGRDSTGRLAAQAASGQIEWTRIVALASAHYVVPSLYPGLRRWAPEMQLPADLWDYLQTVWALNRERNERLKHQLTDLARVLNSAGIEPLLLKGANALLPNAWPGAFDRVLGDLDILVPSRLLPEAVSAMNQSGYSAAPEAFAGSAAAHSHHLQPLLHPDHLGSVELHTKLGRGVLARLLPGEEIRRRAEERSLDGVRLLQPAPFWRLLHALLHTRVQDHHHRRRSLELRQLNDWVQLRLVHESAVDWPAMQRCLAEGGQAVLLPAYLLVAEALYGQPPPAGIRINEKARRVARQTLDALDNRWEARRFLTSVWLLGLPGRLGKLPRKLVTPSWYGHRLRRWGR